MFLYRLRISWIVPYCSFIPLTVTFCYTSHAVVLETPENPIFSFSFEEQRELNLVLGLEYGIMCSDNLEIPDWYHDGELVSGSASDTMHQISESANRQTLKFTCFSDDQMGEFTCVKHCGACTIHIGAGRVVSHLNSNCGV